MIDNAMAFRVFLSAVVVSSLLDMLMLQILRSFNEFTPPFFSGRNSKIEGWVLSKKVLGRATLTFMKERTILFPTCELLFGYLVLLCYFRFGLSLNFIKSIIFLIPCTLLLVIPLLTANNIVPHKITKPSIVIGLLTGLFPSTYGIFNSIIGAAIGFGILYLLYLTGIGYVKLEEKIRGHPLPVDTSLGFGNVTLATMLGAFCGYPKIIIALILGVMIGGVVSLIYLCIQLLRHRYQPFSTIANPPFLIIGGIIAFLI